MVGAGIAAFGAGRGAVVPHPAILTLLIGAVIVSELMSAFALLGHARRAGSSAFLLLAIAYLLPGLLAIPYILTFPGVFAANGLMGAARETSADLWVAWHAAFPALVLAAIVRLDGADDQSGATLVRRVTAPVVGAACAAGVLLTIGLIRFGDALPRLIAQGHPSHLATDAVFPMIAVLNVAALATLYARTRLRSIIDVWLFVALVASLLDSALGLLCARYSAGWYAGKFFMMVASTVMLGAFITEIGSLQKRLVKAKEQIEWSRDREQRVAQERLAHIATHDEYTGIFNRRRIEERCAAMVDAGTPGLVLFIEIDGLKEINDAYGRSSGDAVILEAASRLKRLIGATSSVARYSSKEFVVVAPGMSTTSEDAEAYALGMHAALCRPYVLTERSIDASVSIGVAIFPDDGNSSDDLLDSANAAEHRAKRDGGNVVRLFSREFTEEARSRRLFYDDLVLALERKEFFLQYQPIVDLRSGELVMAEALVRWRSPSRGLVSPADFIPLAEQTDLMLPLGEWVIEEAVRHVGVLRNVGNSIKVALNVSARQLQAAGFCDHLRETVAAGNVSSHDLELEVTESAAMTDASTAMDVLAECSASGFGIALDDFGTHYSSLTYLKRMPIDIVKVDRSFVSGLPTNEHDVAIVAGVLGLARGLHRMAVAEGVETQAQLSWLMRAGCEFAQGYFFARPMNIEDLLSWRSPALRGTGLRYAARG